MILQAAKLNIFVYSSVSDMQMARQSACFAGRPRKYRGRWESANTRIYVATETLTQWRRLQSGLDLSNDNEVAIFLLERLRGSQL